MTMFILGALTGALLTALLLTLTTIRRHNRDALQRLRAAQRATARAFDQAEKRTRP